MEGDLLLRGYRPATRSRYLWCAKRFAAHFGRSPAEMGEAEVRAFLLHLVGGGKSVSIQKLYVAWVSGG